MEDPLVDESMAAAVQDNEDNETIDSDDDRDNDNNDAYNHDNETGMNNNEIEEPPQGSEDEDECRVCRGPAEDG
jgi:hypothetical protein